MGHYVVQVIKKENIVFKMPTPFPLPPNPPSSPAVYLVAINHHQPNYIQSLSFSQLCEHRSRSSRGVRRAGRGIRARGVVCASPDPLGGTVDLGRCTHSHFDARGAEEGVGGAIVDAEVEVYVGA